MINYNKKISERIIVSKYQYWLIKRLWYGYVINCKCALYRFDFPSFSVVYFCVVVQITSASYLCLVFVPFVEFRSRFLNGISLKLIRKKSLLSQVTFALFSHRTRKLLSAHQTNYNWKQHTQSEPCWREKSWSEQWRFCLATAASALSFRHRSSGWTAAHSVHRRSSGWSCGSDSCPK